jgi:branched-chain amino acid transport system permease protein
MKAVILDGIVLGLGLGLLGVGLTLVYGLADVLNLAYGEIAVLAAIVVAEVSGGGVPTAFAAVIGVIAAAITGVLIDLTLMRPVYRQSGGNRVLLGLLLTLGLAFVIEGVLTWRDPLGALSINVAGKPIGILGVPLAVGSVWASVIALAVGAALLVFFTATTFGRAVRSVIQDELGAQLVGVSPSLVRTVIFGLSGGLAGLVAVTQAMTAPVTVTAGFNLTVLALIVSVVGGLGSVAGAFLAGVLLGIVDTVSAYYIGSYVTDIVLLGAAVLTILVRPRGLLGSYGGG